MEVDQVSVSYVQRAVGLRARAKTVVVTPWTIAVGCRSGPTESVGGGFGLVVGPALVGGAYLLVSGLLLLVGLGRSRLVGL
ncbi:hypothetical protein GCM10029964_070890 [Kibdelosporangium lantanae]